MQTWPVVNEKHIKQSQVCSLLFMFELYCTMNAKSLKILVIKEIDWPFVHVCIPQENSLFSTLILGSVFSDYVIFTGIIFTLKIHILKTIEIH